MPDLPDIDSLWNYADNAGSEARFRATLPAAEAAGDNAYLAELFTQLARAVGRQNRFEEAFAILDRAATLFLPGMWRPRARFMLEYGRLLNSSGDPTRALPYFENAFEMASFAKLDRLTVDAVHMIAIAQSDNESKVHWNQRGITLAVELDQPRWLYALYNNLGEAYAANDDFENALATFRKLVALDVEKGKEPNVFAQKDVAKMLRLLRRYKDAMAILIPMEAALRMSNSSNGYVHEEIAECLLAMGDDKGAREHFARAYDLQKADDWVQKHEAKRLKRLRELGVK